jgi:hypothetical protein
MSISKEEFLKTLPRPLQIAIAINESNLRELDWLNHFVDFIQESNSNLYDEASEYADAREEADNE